MTKWGPISHWVTVKESVDGVNESMIADHPWKLFQLQGWLASPQERKGRSKTQPRVPFGNQYVQILEIGQASLIFTKSYNVSIRAEMGS